ncbi:MarR family transcriptional regulator [Halobacterium salinarum]|uniref:MarR family transcriptional regulator n=1 Tax=Halobacterium salinarum TaxID=2242 RepID=UPI002554870D|nr:MarR family transcriptional regulator [Halobacterium salinarum]MDL0129132.1 MarR family transcriptional regulator [Halobacterium salinarum]
MVSSLDEPFPVKPETTEYEVLRVLVTHHEEKLTPTEIAAETALSTAQAAETLGQLAKAEIINQENGVYYIDSGQAERMKQRLESVDAAVELFESAPDDAYARAG